MKKTPETGAQKSAHDTVDNIRGHIAQLNSRVAFIEGSIAASIASLNQSQIELAKSMLELLNKPEEQKARQIEAIAAAHLRAHPNLDQDTKTTLLEIADLAREIAQ